MSTIGVLLVLWRFRLPFLCQCGHDGHHSDWMGAGKDNVGVLMVQGLEAALVVQEQLCHLRDDLCQHLYLS